MSSISSSSSPSHISPSNKVKRTVSQAPIVVGSQTQSKKRSNPSIGKKHPPMTEAQELMDKINKSIDSTVTVPPPPPQKQIYWVEPGPGYGNPMNFKDIPDGETVTFTNWVSWANEDRVGFTLETAEGIRYWADPAAIFILSKASAKNATPRLMSFIVKHEGKTFKYGFLPADYIPVDKKWCIQEIIKDCSKGALIKQEEIKEESLSQKNLPQDEVVDLVDDDDTQPVDGSLDPNAIDLDNY